MESFEIRPTVIMSDAEMENSVLEVQQAFHQRTIIRTKITALGTEVAATLATNLSKADIRVYFAKLNRYQDDIKKLDDAVLVGLKDKAKIRKHKTDSLHYHELVDEIRERLQVKLEDSHPLAAAPQVANAVDNRAGGNAIQPVLSFKLPPLGLRKFDGRDITQFYPWLDDFVEKVDQNQQLSDVLKGDYLKQALEGSALTLILQFSGAKNW